MSLIYQPGYIPPQPIPSVEQKVRAELRKIDPLLDIIWIDRIVPNAVQGIAEGRYALICRWPAEDGRWVKVREEGYTDAYDMLGFFCEDVEDGTSVPMAPDSMMRLIYKLLQNADNEVAPWYDRMKQVFAANLERTNENIKLAEEEAEEAAERSWLDYRDSDPVFQYNPEG